MTTDEFNKIFISVVIPTYNRSKMVCRAVRSVLSQTYRNFEIIVIDDCSSDLTKDIISQEFVNEINKKILLYHKNNTNMERSYCRNKGISLSKGQFIAFLDDDDFFLPYHFETVINYITKYPLIDFLSTEVLLVFENGLIEVNKTGLKTSVDGNANDICFSDKISWGSAVIFKKFIYEKIGGLREDISFGEDREFFERAAMVYKFGYINIPTVCRNMHSGTYAVKKTAQEHAYIKETVWNITEENSKKYSYNLSPKIKYNAYISLAMYFLPNISKSREYLIKAVKVYPLYFFKKSTRDILIRVLIGQKIYSILKKANEYKKKFL